MWLARGHHISTWSDVARHGVATRWGPITVYGMDFMSTGGYVGIIQFSVLRGHSSVHHIIFLPDFDFVQVSVNDDPGESVTAVLYPGYTRRIHQWKARNHPSLPWGLNLFLVALAAYGKENYAELEELCG